MRNFSEQNAVVARFSPQSAAAQAHNIGPFELKTGRRYTAVIKTGVLGTAATVDFKFQAADASDGTFEDIAGAAITQIVKADGDNKVAILEISADVVESLKAGRSHARGVLTVGAAASLVDVTIFASHLRYGPAEDFDLSEVAEIAHVVN